MANQFYGLAISGDLLSEGVLSSTDGAADIFISRLSSGDPVRLPPQWFMHLHLPGGEVWASFGKLDEGFLIRFSELAQFVIRDQGREILCCPEGDTPVETLQHLLFNQVLPLVINLKGGEALHASSVLVPGGAIAFTGATGLGKSTVSGSFVSAGFSLLSDDCLALQEKEEMVFAFPGHPGLRLWEDSAEALFRAGGTSRVVAHYTSKRYVDVERVDETFCLEPKPLQRLYIISGPPESEAETDIAIGRMSLTESFMALVRCAVRLDITDRDMLTRQFRFLERVVSKVPVRKLTYPRDFNFLPAVREAVLKDLEDPSI
jgi:hypothetical protein